MKCEHGCGTELTEGGNEIVCEHECGWTSHTPERCRDALRAQIDEARREVREYAEAHGPALAALTLRVVAAEKRAVEAERLKEAAQDALVEALQRAAEEERMRLLLAQEYNRLDARATQLRELVEESARIVDALNANIQDQTCGDVKDLISYAVATQYIGRARAALAEPLNEAARDALVMATPRFAQLEREKEAWYDAYQDERGECVAAKNAAADNAARAERLRAALIVIKNAEMSASRPHTVDAGVRLIAADALGEGRTDARDALAGSAPEAAWRGADSCVLDPGERSDDEPQPWNVATDMKTTSAFREFLRARISSCRANRGDGRQLTNDDALAVLDDLDAALNALTSARVVAAIDWDDADDGWSKEIKAAHPARTGAHNRYAVAMMMVGHRHSKGQLVALVCWLLGRAEEAERLRKSSEDDALSAIGKMRAALADAHELATEGWGYAGDYFRTKWRVDTRLEEIAEVLAKTNPAMSDWTAVSKSVARALSDLLAFIFDGASYPLAYGGRFRILACDARDALRAARGDDDDEPEKEAP